MAEPVPAALAGATLKAAAAVWAAGGAVAGVVSARGAALVQGVCQEVLMSKLRLAAAWLLMVGLLGGAASLLGGAASLLGSRPRPAAPPAGEPAAAAPERPAPADDKRPAAPAVPVFQERPIFPANAHPGGVFAVVFSPDGKTLATGGADGAVKLWDVATGVTKGVYRGHDSLVLRLHFSPDGRLAVSATDAGDVHLWDVATQRRKAALADKVDLQMGTLAFAPDGKTLATADGLSQAVQLWDVATGRKRGGFRGHSGQVTAVAFVRGTPGAVASVYHAGSAFRWDAATGRVLQAMPQEVVRAAVPAAAVPGNGLGGTDLPWNAFRAVSPDGRTLASLQGPAFQETTVQLWDLNTGAVRRTLAGPKAAVKQVSFTPDGQTLAAVSADGVVQLWDAATGKERAAVSSGVSGRVVSVGLAPDGRAFAVASEDGLKLYVMEKKGR
jgi:WD40 repeat protein